jgi:hypothetical protein
MEGLEIAAQYGLPTLLLAAFAWAAWKAVGAAWRDVVLPVRDRAFGFLDKVERNIDTFSDNLMQQTDSLKKIEANSTVTARGISDLRRQCELRGLGVPPHQNGEQA